MLTLAIETSGRLGSVAVLESGRVLREQTLDLGRQHGQSLLPSICEVLADCGKKVRDLKLVAVSVGPGSFTGVRIGVVCAKTLAYAVPCPLVAVDALHAIACNTPANVNRVEVIGEAQRGDLFTVRFERSPGGEWHSPRGTAIQPVDAWIAGLQPQDAVSGPAVEKVASLIPDSCQVLAPEYRVPRAVWIARLGLQALEANGPADLWSVEPLYLRRSSAEVQWEKLHRGKK